MNNFQVLGKFLDQPILVSKFQKAVPALLTTGAAAFTVHDAYKEKDPEARKKRALKTGITLGVTVASALAAPHIASAITKRPLGPTLEVVKAKNKELVDSFVSSTKLNEKTSNILQKSKGKILNFKEVKHIFEDLRGTENGKDFLGKLIPAPENIKAKDIFSEIGYLSIFGAVPVVGGIAGGIAADKVTDNKHWKEKIPNKIKEGSYQYLANIFMCNIGASVALAIMEKMGVTSKVTRALGMTAGIILTGVIGGSKVANFISNKFIDPCFKKMNKKHHNEDDTPTFTSTNLIDIYEHNKKCNGKGHCKCKKMEEKPEHRKPEALDIGLHTDDISTVSLLSGLKWIEPALPFMYTLSGYRAGIGYRN